MSSGEDGSVNLRLIASIFNTGRSHTGPLARIRIKLNGKVPVNVSVAASISWWMSMRGVRFEGQQSTVLDEVRDRNSGAIALALAHEVFVWIT